MIRKHNTKLTQNARNLRKNMTKEERYLWYDFLRDYPVRFLRQKVIDDYIVDFYCHEARLIIELDGSQHYEEHNIQQDQIRTEKLEQRGLTVIRIPNNEIYRNFKAFASILTYLLRIPQSSPNGDASPPLGKGALMFRCNKMEHIDHIIQEKTGTRNGCRFCCIKTAVSLLF